MIHTSKQVKDKVRNISHGDNQTAQIKTEFLYIVNVKKRGRCFAHGEQASFSFFSL